MAEKVLTEAQRRWLELSAGSRDGLFFGENWKGEGLIDAGFLLLVTVPAQEWAALKRLGYRTGSNITEKGRTALEAANG